MAKLAQGYAYSQNLVRWFGPSNCQTESLLAKWTSCQLPVFTLEPPECITLAQMKELKYLNFSYAQEMSLFQTRRCTFLTIGAKWSTCQLRRMGTPRTSSKSLFLTNLTWGCLSTARVFASESYTRSDTKIRTCYSLTECIHTTQGREGVAILAISCTHGTSTHCTTSEAISCII